MPDFIRVSAADTASTGRMDPAFHLQAKRMAPLVDTLKSKRTAEEAAEAAKRLLDIMPAEMTRECLKDLRRDKNSKAWGPNEMSLILRNHPHLALACLIEASGRALNEMEATARRLLDQVQALRESASSLRGQAGPTPPATGLSGPKPR